MNQGQNRIPECSTIEAPHYFGVDEPSLRKCASGADDGNTVTELSVDGKPVALSETETASLSIVLPEDNIFALPG